MKKAKKLLSLLLAFAMVFTLAVPATFAADFSDVPTNYQYYDAVQSLVARGIINGYEDGTFKPEATITRAEFAKMVIYAIGMGNLAQDSSVSTGFPDVSSEHWAAGVIKIAYDLKIINGFDDGTFKPDENVTYDQALKMAVCAKYDKFGEAAMKNGGYPEGYRKVAASYGFIKNITDGVYSEPAKRGTIAKLMDNMLAIKLSEITNDATIVEPNQMAEIKGQVVSVYGASLEAAPVVMTKYQVRILLNSGAVVTYDASALPDKESLRSYLGKMVTAYYTEQMGLEIQPLSSMTLQRNRNYEVVVDMASVIQPVTNNEMTYTDEKGDFETLKIASGAKILYNGSLAPGGTTFSDLVTANASSAGSIRLMATGGDSSSVDVIFFTVYSNYIVTSTNSSTKTVFLDDGSKIVQKVLDEEDRSKTVTITKNGSNVSFSSIAKDQVLSISEDLSGNNIEVLIGPAAFEGRVSGMTRDEGKVTINSKEYKFAPGVSFGADVVVGANLKVYLDSFNKIAKYEFKATAVSYNYAYLTQIKNVGSGISADIRAELIDLKTTTLKSFTTYPLADTVKINNVNYKVATDFAAIEDVLKTAAQRYVYTESSKTFGAGANEVHQPIKYTLTNDGKIDSILVGKDNATEADLRVDTSILDSMTYPQGIKCTTQYTSLANIYTLTSSTKVLYISDQTQRAITDYDLKSGTNSGLQLNEYYRVVFVDKNSTGTPAVLLVYNIDDVDVSATTNDWLNSLPVIVTGMPQIEGYNTITVQGYNGPEKTYKDEGTTFYSQVAIGDVIRLVADTDGIIENLEIVAKGNEILAGTDYVKLGAHHATTSYTKINGDNSEVLLYREGDYNTQEKATMSVMAGTLYSYINNTLRVALDYTNATEIEANPNQWDEILLGQENRLQQMSTSSTTKVVEVTMKAGSPTIVNTTLTLDQMTPYVTGENASPNAAAERIFVYRSGSSARLIVVYRQK
ncbi:MAG: S-layer homology domain-containing protein [Clostridia bacterium]|nr:S-layer homology domain-containing protein [Clostridia bacterium]